jgi:peptide-methionine (S)-S-oxide reductase
MRKNKHPEKNDTATFAGGCFWCTEAVFQRIKGIISVTPGYAGGSTENPDYESVLTGNTGHAESVMLIYDPGIITYEKLLDIFWHIHDPTTLNRQGADVGTQYRSAIFYHHTRQKKAAEESKNMLTKSGSYPDEIVTEIVPFSGFTKAEDYHRDYYEKNTANPYCRVVIDPKIRKLMETYRPDIKKEYLEDK